MALDDFGTGYSSLAYLCDLPVDLLKVDRTFVKGIGQNPRDEELIHAVIALGRGLGLKVLAEGVETGVQLEWLRAQGCDLGQGFFLSRPAPLEALELAPGAGTGPGLRILQSPGDERSRE